MSGHDIVGTTEYDHVKGHDMISTPEMSVRVVTIWTAPLRCDRVSGHHDMVSTTEMSV